MLVQAEKPAGEGTATERRPFPLCPPKAATTTILAKEQMMMMSTEAGLGRLPLAAAAALAAALCVSGPAAAQQGLDNEQAIDTIIGTEVEEEEVRAEAEPARLIAAIENTREAIATVRKTSALDKVDIVFLPDAASTEGGPPPEVEAKIEEHSEQIDELRQELEGNAMLYHAIDSREILLRDVLAVEFDDQNGVVIYAAAKPAE